MLFSEPEIQHEVDQLLTEKGSYRHVDWLVRAGRLDPRDLSRWRDGEAQMRLCDMLYGDPIAIGRELKVAAAYARSLQLVADREPASAPAGAPAGLPEQWAELAWRKPPAPQLDLFFDNGGATGAHALAQALAAGDADGAEAALDALEKREPGHPLVAGAPRLVAALRDLPEDPVAAWTELEAVGALAETRLGDAAAKFMSVLWRRLARRLEQTPDCPIHPSAAWMRVPEWRAVADSLGPSPAEIRGPELLARGIRARHRLGEHRVAAVWFCHLCWRYPEMVEDIERHAEQALDLDAALEAWNDRELADRWGWREFPSWLLLHGYFSPDLGRTEQAAPASFAALGKLLAAPDDITARQRLQAASPEVLREFLRVRSSGSG